LSSGCMTPALPRPRLRRSSAHPGRSDGRKIALPVGRTVLQRAEGSICIRMRSRPLPTSRSRLPTAQ
jgi:hypothetical protein